MKTNIQDLKPGDLVAWAYDNGRKIVVYRTRVFRVLSDKTLSVYLPGRSQGKGAMARYIGQGAMDLAQDIIARRAALKGKAAA